MAKALYGHVGGPDLMLVAEVAQLRRRVRDLEDEVERLSAANEALTSLVAEEHLAGQLSDLDRVELPADATRHGPGGADLRLRFLRVGSFLVFPLTLDRRACPAGSPPRAPQEPDPARLQVLRVLDDAALRAGDHLRRRTQRVRQVQRGRCAGLGHGRAGGQVPARRQDGGRHLRRHVRPPAAGPGRGAADHRQRRRRAADRLLRGHDLADHVPERRLASTPSTASRADCWTSRSSSRTPASAARCT